MSQPEKTTEVSSGDITIFAALSDVTRVNLVRRICQTKSVSIAELTKGSGITRQAVTKHLRVLEKAGLIQAQTYGREKHWTQIPDGLNPATMSLAALTREWDAALEA
ncbi:MAG: DNA-binding transcriptional ArsR family regulator [Planctomycetota bacterium]|jgi:DNA-binding transcriptional ArsR family regulator